MTKHEALAKAYLAYIGKRGTPKQVSELMNQLDEATLLRMVADRDREWVDRNIRD